MNVNKENIYNGRETVRKQQLDGVSLASFKSRAGAFIIDSIIVVLIAVPILMFGGMFLGRLGLVSAHSHFEFNFENWYSMMFVVLYHSLSIYCGKGRTLGKYFFGIRVVSVVHEHINLWHAIERALGYGASLLEFGFGFFQYFIDENRRTVHDRIAETIVIKDR
ncbi:MAG TPA: RDD family protein [Bacteroidota bacterium]|nr:RDD family protein [Bacteroidota bacterium]